MPIQLFDTKDAVPETYRATAVETKDGKFAASVDDPELGERGQAALKKERDARKVEKERADAAERERDELKHAADAHEKGISKEALDKIREAEALARKPIEAERDRLAVENRKLKLTDKVRALYLDPKTGGIAGRVEDAMDQLAKRTDLDDSGEVVFKDKNGNITADDAATFFAKFRVEKAFYFTGTGGSGSGAEADSTAGAPDAAAAATAAGKAAAAVQKKGAAENALAFK